MSEPTAQAADYLGLKTDDYARREVVGQQVQWIAWDSPADALLIGDIILGVDAAGASLDGAAIPRLGYPPAMSHAFWDALGADPGTPLTLAIRRGDDTLQVQVTPIVERFYHSPEGQRALFPGGPYQHSRGAFRESWASWYERVIKVWSNILCDGWRQRSFKTRELLAEHAEERVRIELLLKDHPGPFADHWDRAWSAVQQNLQGTPWPADTIDLTYRELAKQRAEIFKAAARRAHQAYEAEIAGQLSDPFPAPDPYDTEAENPAGTLVMIDRVSPRDMRSDGVQAWYILGDRRKGVYFLDAHAPEVLRLGDGILAYQRQVSPTLAEHYRFYLRVTDAPMMRSKGGREIAIGFKTQLVAALVGQTLFMRDLDTETPVLAGAETLDNSAVAVPADDANPEDVARARIDAIKRMRLDVWKALFADWTVSADMLSKPILLPYRSRSNDHSSWEQSQKRLFSDVLDVVILSSTPPYTVLPARPAERIPHIEECEVIVEHVGVFDGEHRSFKDPWLTRVWRLQRADGGPWRIAYPQAL